MPEKFNASPLNPGFNTSQGNALQQPNSAKYAGMSTDLTVPSFNNSKSSSNPDTLNVQDGSKNQSNNGLHLGWVNQVNSFVSQYSLDTSGYGGSVDTSGYGGSVGSTKHANQGIGNGMEGADPGKSQPHGGSNDEGGRTPGQRWVPNLLSALGL